jgi:hypothetical protein
VRPLRTLGQNGCPNCLLFSECGGHPLPLIYRLGCANSVASVLRDTDDMHPDLGERFWELWRDAAGLTDHSVSTLRPIETSGLPRYIPVLQNHHLRPAKPLALEVVSIPLFKVVGKLPGGGYGVRFPDGATLRRKFGLKPNARIILRGVDHDPPLETFWAKHRLPGILQALAALDVDVSTPNFSFFTCVTGFQILRNRKRTLLCAEHLSQAGIRVALHLNANTDAHWAFWLNLLRQHPEVTCVTVEFQTGALLDQEYGRYTFDQLVNLQNQLGRRLHFLLVGAARFYPRAVAELKSFSVLDSRPFICATKRQMLKKAANGAYVWNHYPTRKGASLASLFEHNLRSYKEMLKRGLEEPEPDLEEKGQLQLSLLLRPHTSRPTRSRVGSRLQIPSQRSQPSPGDVAISRLYDRTPTDPRQPPSGCEADSIARRSLSESTAPTTESKPGRVKERPASAVPRQNRRIPLPVASGSDWSILHARNAENSALPGTLPCPPAPQTRPARNSRQSSVAQLRYPKEQTLDLKQGAGS